MDYGMDHIHSHLLKKKELVAICLGLLNNANNNGNGNKWRYFSFMAKIIYDYQTLVDLTFNWIIMRFW